MKKMILALLLLTLGATMVNAADYDFKFIDGYLEKWDRFSNGDNNLVPYIRENKARFEAQLSAALLAQDKKAPARMVFYTVVQVGGYIPTTSELGKAVAFYIGKDFPTTKNKDGSKVYSAGDLYFWWDANKSNYDAYPLFAQWMERDFAKQVVLPMYNSTSRKR